MASLLGHVLDNYRIIENLGAGGMGVVYKAIHTKLEKIVALKMISPMFAMDDKFIKRFETEAKALAKLEDPNIVSIYDLRSDNNRWFIIMEYIDGINLSDKLAKDGAYNWKESISILMQILSAINHAHKANIIHRDLKPQNVMITEAGIVKITDFGLAKDQTVVSNTITITGGGTLFYMSPEHVKGFTSIDYRSDIYSIGMTFYEMITGKVPFENIDSDFDIREMIVRKEFVKPTIYNSEIPVELEAIVMKSIAKNPKDRFQSIEEMTQAVLRFREDFTSGDAKIIKNQKWGKKQTVPKLVVKEEQEEYNTIKPEIISKSIWLSNNLKFILTGISAILILLIIAFYSGFFSLKKDSPKQNMNNSIFNLATSPEQAIVFLNKDSIGTTPLSQFTAQEGMHNIKIKKNGYVAIDTTISLEANSNLSLAFNLSKIKQDKKKITTLRKNKEKPAVATSKHASLLISSNPPNANIFLNTVKKGRTPKTLQNIKPGNYNIKIARVGFEEYHKKVKLRPEKDQSVKVNLVRITGNLKININQPNVQVFINNKLYSQSDSPFELNNLPVGKYRVNILKKGYSKFLKDVLVKRNETVTFDATLVMLTGKLSILVKPWGSIFINNELQKSSTDIKFNIDLPVDNYNIKIEHPTFGVWQKVIQIKTGESADIEVNFNETISVNVNANDENGNPLSCDIFLNDKFTGKKTPQTLNVRTGIHELYVKKNGYKSQKSEPNVLIDNNLQQPIVFKLLKK